jgi:hypothetical protein
MIENRSKIEKQIFLGRQYVRRSVRGRADPRSMLIQNNPELRPPGSIPTPSISPPNTSSEQPMSADPDAEAAFSQGSRWFFTRGHRTTPSPPSEAVEGNEQADPLRSPTIRRKWTSELLRPPSNESVGLNEHREHRRSRASTFFSKFRRGSATPPIVRGGSQVNIELDRESEDTWSSDSSSDELMLSTRFQRRSWANFNDDHED